MITIDFALKFIFTYIMPVFLVLLAKGKDKNAYWYGFVIALYQTILTRVWGNPLSSIDWASTGIYFVLLMVAASISFVIVNKINPRLPLIYLILWIIFYYVMYSGITYLINYIF